MKKMLRKVSLIIILVVIPSMIFAQPVIYPYTGRVNVTFGWDHNKDANFDHYEFEVKRLGINDTVVEIFTYGTLNLTIVILRPRAGTYEARVRAINNSQGTFIYSDWCSSLNPACAKLKTGINGAWKVRWKISAPLIIGPID